MTADAGRFRLGYVPALDGLRGVAVAAVVLFHAGVGWAAGGWVGVDVFFVLSGFLITSLLLQERRDHGTVSFRRFYARRALRLLPAVVTLVAALAVYAGRVDVPDEANRVWGDARATLLYYANWRLALGDAPLLGFLAHTWSLSIEEQFYAAWPVLALLAVRIRGLALAAAVAAAGALAAPVLRLAWWDGRESVFRLYYGTDTRLDGLLLGALLAVCLAAGWLPAGRRARRPAAILAVPATVTLVAVAGRVGFESAPVYRGLLFAAEVSAAVVVAHVVLSPGGIAARALSFGPVVWLGRISYGVYLWHWPVLLATASWGSRWWQLAARVGAGVGCAAASYVLVERPALRLKRRLHRLRPAGPGDQRS